LDPRRTPRGTESNPRHGRTGHARSLRSGLRLLLWLIAVCSTTVCIRATARTSSRSMSENTEVKNSIALRRLYAIGPSSQPMGWHRLHSPPKSSGRLPRNENAISPCMSNSTHVDRSTDLMAGGPLLETGMNLRWPILAPRSQGGHSTLQFSSTFVARTGLRAATQR
jgi:hypothetical protein